MYAVVRTGGKQYRVEPGTILEVERLPVEAGTTVDLDDVLLIEQDGAVTVGAPTIEGAKVVADVLAQDRHDKIIVFKYKAKVRYRRRVGHKQPLTRLAVREIVAKGAPKRGASPKPDDAGAEPAAPRRRASRAAGDAAE